MRNLEEILVLETISGIILKDIRDIKIHVQPTGNLVKSSAIYSLHDDRKDYHSIKSKPKVWITFNYKDKAYKTDISRTQWGSLYEQFLIKHYALMVSQGYLIIEVSGNYLCVTPSNKEYFIDVNYNEQKLDDLSSVTCTCADYLFNKKYCKHIFMALGSQALINKANDYMG